MEALKFDFNALAERVISGEAIDRQQALELLETHDENLLDLMAGAGASSEP